MSDSAFDVAVIGLGATGAAALYQLARRGARVIGVDRFRPPHRFGSSHGETRVTRQAIGEGEAYVPLALRSQQIWRELERAAGETLFRACGTLILQREDCAALHHGKSDFLVATRAAARRHQIAHEDYDGERLRARFPQFQLDGDERGYFEPGAGLLYPERCIAAQLALAERHGARLYTDWRVRTLRDRRGGVTLDSERGSIDAAQTIVAAGPWLPQLLPDAPPERFRVYRQVQHWFPVEQPQRYRDDRFPVFLWTFGDGSEDYLYGFPSQDGETVKLASEQYSVVTAPDALRRDVGADEAEAFYRRCVAGRLSGVGARARRSLSCMYTVTPDGDFVLGRHPERRALIVASPCSGHGFKHSAAVGEALAQLALDGASDIDLGGFAY